MQMFIVSNFVNNAFNPSMGALSTFPIRSVGLGGPPPWGNMGIIYVHNDLYMPLRVKVAMSRKVALLSLQRSHLSSLTSSAMSFPC